MINRLVIRNLFHRPVRTGLTILAVALEVMMILMMVGVSEGLLRESQRRTRGVGADILIRPQISGATITSADISEKLPEVLMQRFPEISFAMGSTVFTPGDLQTITGIDWPELERMSGGIVVFEGRPYAADYECVIDEVYAQQKQLGVGGKTTLMNHEFEVSGIIETGKMSRIFIPLETMRELQGWQGKFSQIYVKLEDSEQARGVIDRLKALLPNLSVISVEDFLALAATNIRQMSDQFVNVIISLALVIGFIVVLLAMYTAILERTREIGILKALGASKTYIVGVVMRETVVICLFGILLGYGLSFLGRAAVAARFPLVPVILLPEWMVWAALLAVVGSVIGALYPAWKAAEADPIEALAYE